MARMKKPDNETQREQEIRQVLERIANVANRSEKTSWNRKMDNVVKLLMTLEPIEDEILQLILSKKTPIMDEIGELRKLMVKECVHPFEYLTINENDPDNIVTCKFCNKKINAAHWLND